MKTRLLTLRTFAFSLLSVCLICSATSADVTGNSGNSGGTAIAIPDNTPGGVVSTVTITEQEVITDAKFCIEGLNHNWIGDLIITVAHSTSGKMATLMHRVGTTSNPNSTGDDSNLAGTYEFADPASPSIWTAAAGGGTTFDVPVGTYAASGQNEAVVDLNAIFGGEMTNGTWTFNISDNNGGALDGSQTGSFVRTAVKFESTAAVPEPGSAAILGALLGGVFLRRRRR